MTVVLSDPFRWQAHFVKDGALKKAEDMPETYYVWGANTYNYKYRTNKLLGYTDRVTGETKEGSGQAGRKGPTLGKAHPKFVGVVSIFKPGDSLSSIAAAIDGRFAFLKRKLRQGARIEFPMEDKTKELPKKYGLDYVAKHHGLGKGVARDRLKTARDIARWEKIQARIEMGIRSLV